jgi:hypothetical protein
MLICNNCGVEFAARRGDARFCSAKCRVAHGRKPSGVAERAAVRESTEKIAAAVLEHAGDTRTLYACCKHCRHPLVAGHLDPCRVCT